MRNFTGERCRETPQTVIFPHPSSCEVARSWNTSTSYLPDPAARSPSARTPRLQRRWQLAKPGESDAALGNVAEPGSLMLNRRNLILGWGSLMLKRGILKLNRGNLC
eukprot:886651-Rhodomonas_salina.1